MVRSAAIGGVDGIWASETSPLNLRLSRLGRRATGPFSILAEGDLASSDGPRLRHRAPEAAAGGQVFALRLTVAEVGLDSRVSKCGHNQSDNLQEASSSLLSIASLSSHGTAMIL